MSIKVFYCYAHEDKALRATLEKHLGNLKRQELITGWSDRNIDAGKEWAKEIDSNLNVANIILLLISPDFMHSEYCYSIEMRHALERHENGTARVIPIILRHVEYEGAPFSRLQALPTGAVPITDRKWRNRDEAFYDVAQGIRKVVKELLSEQWLYEGNIHFYREEYEEALTAFERAICFDPTNASAYIGQGETLVQLIPKQVDPFDDGNEKALAAFERAISLDNTNACAYIGKGKTLLRIHPYYYKEAVKVKILETLKQAIKLDPKNAEAYTVQGDAFIEFRRYEEALTAYEKAIEVAPFFNRHAYNGKGNALYKLERYEEAIDLYDRVIQEMPKWVYSHKQKGDALYNLERYEEALAVYEQAISLNDPDASIHTKKGNTLYHLNRYQEALTAYELAIKLGLELSKSEKAEAYKGKSNVLGVFADEALKIAEELDPPFLPDLPDDLP